MTAERTVQWPRKHEVFRVGVSATTYDEAVELIMTAAAGGVNGTVAHMAVHGLVLAGSDPSFRAKINQFDLVAPDGQPVRWALNVLRGVKLPDRVYGPELMLRLCRRASELGVGVYLYGSEPDVARKLRQNLAAEFPSLRIVGCEAPPFRPLSPEEERAVVERINGSGAGLVFLGLGCPKQEDFAYRHRDRIKAVQVCVGAAFDFHAGSKKMAPPWMQRRGLEWLYRLVHEPRRLWRRYLWTNTLFMLLLVGDLLRGRR